MSAGDESKLLMEGLLYKRRNGLGKHFAEPWVYRFFTLTNSGILSYFETPYDPSCAEDREQSKARGRVDLRAIDYELHREPSIDGAPTNFAFTLRFPDEKWKLCAESDTDHSQWCMELENFRDASAKDTQRFPLSSSPLTIDTTLGNENIDSNAIKYSSPVHGKLPQVKSDSNSNGYNNKADAAGDGDSNNDVIEIPLHSSSNTNTNTNDHSNQVDSSSSSSSAAMISIGKVRQTSTGGRLSHQMNLNTKTKKMGKVKINRNAVDGGSFLDFAQLEEIFTVILINYCLYLSYKYYTFNVPGSQFHRNPIIKIKFPEIFENNNNSENTLFSFSENVVSYIQHNIPYSGHVIAFLYLLLANIILITTLSIRNNRYTVATVAKIAAQEALKEADGNTVNGNGHGNSISVVSGSMKSTHDSSIKFNIPVKAKAGAGVGVSVGNSMNKGSGDSGSIVEEDSPENDETDIHMVDGKPVPGYTMEQVTNISQRNAPMHTWSIIDHQEFHVRVGPNYNWNKKKAPSDQPLYQPFAIDIFSSAKRIDNAGSRFSIPKKYTDVKTNNEFVPPVFIVQIQIPAEAPALWNSVEDGAGWSMCMFFAITEQTIHELKNIETASPAVKLWAKWCEFAENDKSWRSRFKFISASSNLAELGVPSYISNYNAKPILIRRTGTLFRGEGSKYMEFDMHIHKFDYAAKKGIFYMTSLCNEMLCQIGYVIEGRDDEELPETLFGCCALNRPQETMSPYMFDE
jgi:hypothetical protein